LTKHHGTPRYNSIGGLRKALTSAGLRDFPHRIERTPSGMFEPVFELHTADVIAIVRAKGFRAERIGEERRVSPAKIVELEEKASSYQRIAAQSQGAASFFFDQQQYTLASFHQDRAEFYARKARGYLWRLIDINK
jgi:hypothetical protein